MSHAMASKQNYTIMISFRITPEQERRLEELMGRLQTRSRHANKTDFLRELLSVEDNDLVTKADRDFLSGKITSNVKKLVPYETERKVSVRKTEAAGGNRRQKKGA